MEQRKAYKRQRFVAFEEFLGVLGMRVYSKIDLFEKFPCENYIYRSDKYNRSYTVYDRASGALIVRLKWYWA